MSETPLIGFINNVALLLGLAWLFELFIVRPAPWRAWLRQGVAGLLIGGIGVAVMMTPWVLMPGVTFDTRSVLLGLCGLFFGWLPTLIAMSVTAATRVLQGGSGMLTGVMVIVATGSIGLAWRAVRKRPLEQLGGQELYLFGWVTHLVMLAFMFTLPWETAQKALINMGPVVLGAYPLGTLLLGLLLVNQLRREKKQEDLLHATARINASQALAKMGGWEWDVASQTMYWTAETYRIHGFAPNGAAPVSPELLQKSYACYLPADRLVMEAAFQNCIATGQSYDLEMPFTSAVGELLWVRTRVEAVWEQGRVARLVGNIMDISARKQIEEQLSNTRVLLEQTYMQSPVPMVLATAPDRVIRIINAAAAEFLGIDPADYLDRPYDAMTLPWQNFDTQGQEIAASDLPLPLALRGITTQNCEILVTFPDRPRRWQMVSGAPIYSHTGQLIGGLIVFPEITKRKLAEAALHESEERFRKLSEDMPVYISAFLPDGTLTYANPALAMLSGAAPADMIGLNFLSFLTPQDREVVEAQLRRLTPAQPVETHEQHHYTPAGEERIQQWTNRAFFDGEGRTLRFQAVGYDITPRKQAEAALRQSHETTQALMNAATESVFLMTVDGTVIVANETTAARLGQPMENLVGGSIYRFLSSELVESRKKQIETVVRARSPIHFEDERFGTWLENNIYPILDADGEVRRVAVYGRDITERKRAEAKMLEAQAEQLLLLAETERSRRALLSVVEDQKTAEEHIRRLNLDLERRVAERTAQLTATNRELEAFSYSVSHDLRAPLRILDGFSHVLLDNHAEQLDDYGKHCLSRIRESTRRMGQLIDDLLNLSRITRADFARQPVDLSAMVENIAAELQAQTPERQVQFEIARELQVQGDRNLLKIALENLLNNAYKFTNRREQACIQFGVLEQAGKPVYFVRDNGAGFDMEYAGRLFSPFQRLHGAQEFAGTGIGLTIVQRIITRHHGRIWPEAAAGQGATFFFTLWEQA